MNTAFKSLLAAELWSMEPRRFQAMLQAAELGNRPANRTGLKVQRLDGTAIVPVHGVMWRRPPVLARAFLDVVDTAEVSAAVAALDADPSITRVIFDFDSPGGAVSGVPELAKEIAAMKTPTTAATSGMCASAAYWCACGCDRLLASESAVLGSVGVYSTHTDSSEMLKRAGVAVEVFRSGDLKGAGISGTPLSDAQREHLQAQVDGLFGMFREHVAEYRPGVSGEVWRGGSFLGRDAVAAGLADGLIGGTATNESGGTPSPTAAAQKVATRAVAEGRVKFFCGGGHYSVSWEEARAAAEEIKN